MPGEHQDHTKTFEQLEYAAQTKSISGQIHSLEKAIEANIRRAAQEGRESPLTMRIEQVERLVQRLK